MRFLHFIRSGLIALALLPLLAAAAGSRVDTEQVSAELLLHAPEGVAPGKSVWLGLQLSHRPHWHSYWRNPGDSGLPTRMSWTLPPGLSVGEIQWPSPQRLPIGPMVNYGYEGQVLLAVPVTVTPEFADGASVRLQADWLVCKEVCIPESGEFTLRVGRGSVVASAAGFARAQALIPQAHASEAQARVADGALAFEVDALPSAWHDKPLLAFPEEANVFDHAGQPEVLWRGASLSMRLPLSEQRSESPSEMHVLLRPVDASRDEPSLRVALRLKGAWAALAAADGLPRVRRRRLPRRTGLVPPLRRRRPHRSCWRLCWPSVAGCC